MRKLIVSTIISAATATLALAGNENDLDETLDQATQIATLAKINVDYVPSVVSVQKGDKLKELGANTVYDALEMLPGIQMQLNELGQVVTVARGFKNPNSSLSDKIKVILDGVVVSSDTFGRAGYIMSFPIELVDRIEVLRGPGSTVYGSGAFYGVVNIITKSNSMAKCDEMFVGYGSWDYRSIGACQTTLKNGLKYSADGFYQGSNRALKVDSTYTDAGANFPRDYTTSEGFYNLSAGFTIKSENATWTTRIFKSRQGNYFGKEEKLEPTTDTGQTNQLFTSELKYKYENPLGTTDLSVGVKDYVFDMDEVYRDKSYQNRTGSAFDYNYYDTYKVAETTLFTKAVHRFNNIYNNSISVSADASYTKIRENYFYSNLESFAFANPNDPLIVSKYSGEPSLQPGLAQNNSYLKDGLSRGVLGFDLEDTYSITHDTDITMGARLTKQTGLDTEIDYRVGVVSRWLNDSLIGKLIYSTGHRAPTLSESYTLPHINFEAGDSNIQPERIKSYEVQLTYKPSSSNRVSINGYYSEISNIIDLEQILATQSGYEQYPKRVSKGIEAEYSYIPNTRHELNLNASFNNTSYLNTDNLSISQNMPDISPIMYKAWYLYKPTSTLSVGAKYQYLSKTTQNEVYDRDTTIPAQQKIDLSLHYKLSKPTAISFYLNNVLDSTQRMPSYYYRNVVAAGSDIGRTINEGAIREGRNFLVELTHKF